MQLNSKSTHEVIIAEITYGILAKCFVNDLKQVEKSATFTDWQLNKNQATELTIAEFEQKQAYEYLLTLPEFSNFEISETKNWKFADEIIRLIVDKNKLTPHLLANDAVGQLVSYVLADPNIKQKTIDTLDGFIYIYLKFINPDHLPILESADCIVIDLM